MVQASEKWVGWSWLREYLKMGNVEDPVVTLVAATVVSFATAIFTSVFASFQYWRAQKAELEKEFLLKFNDKKWEVYTQFSELVRDIAGDQSSDSSELDGKKVSLASQIVLIGSDEVVDAFRSWYATAELHEKGDATTEDKLFELIVSMRKDLGNKYTRLGKETLLGALDPKRQSN